MFRRSNNSNLSLDIDEQSLSFASTAEFEFALAGRTCLPPNKLANLMAQSDETLMREAEGIRAVEKRFSDALSGVLKDVTSISPFLKELEMGLISQDHDWRQIMMALNQTDRSHEEFKKIALVKYMQYLTARQETIQSVYASRQATRTAVLNSQPSASGANGAGHANGKSDDADNNQFRSTVIFNVNQSAHAEPEESRKFGRIPKGETVEFSLHQDEEAPLLLAQHRCTVLNKDRLMFVDNQGHDTDLQPGKSIIGRDLSCDIVVDPSLREVSRKHLIVEVEGELIRLTDISSHGTSVPEEFLENTSI